MSLVKRLFDRHYEKKAGTLILDGNFNEALPFLKKISSKRQQGEIINIALFTYSLMKRIGHPEEYQVLYFHDLGEYEKYKSICGDSVDHKCPLYVDDTGRVAKGMAEIIETEVSNDEPIVQYWLELTVSLREAEKIQS